MNKLLLIILFIIFYSCSNHSERLNKTYFNVAELFRTTKDSMFQNGEKSPFNKRGDFTELKYFPANVKYKITASVTTLENPEIVQMPTTSDRLPVYLKRYRFDFVWEGDSFSLWGFYRKDNPGSVFLPFKDLTNTTETYGGGRYLDLTLPFKKNQVILDFNYAYHPYCHYDTGFSCPIVPFDNHLPIELKAGEKNYE